MAQHGTGEVLTILDERPATAFYWRLSLRGRYEDVRKAVTTLGAADVSVEDIRRGAAALEATEAPAGRRFRGWTPAAWRAWR